MRRSPTAIGSRARAATWLLLGSAAALASAADPPAPSGPSAARASVASPSAPPPLPQVSPLVAASRAAQAARASAPASRVWTLEDLEALKREPAGTLNVVDLPSPGAIDAAGGRTRAYRPPAGVGDRYRELVAQADAELAKLERERLATTNPLLRGMGGESPRTPAQIATETAKWRERREAAARGLGSTP